MPVTEQEKKAVRHLTPGTVKIATETGLKDVPALTTERVPGLALTMSNFGLFNVTHVGSGLNMSGTYERWGSACLVLARYAAIGRAYGVDFTAAQGDVLAALREHFSDPVPFEGATCRGAAGERPLTCQEWLGIMRGDELGDEFPWEAPSESPECQAFALFDTLAAPTLVQSSPATADA